MIVISDTSSISNLIQIDLLDVVHELFGDVTITPAVKRELYRIPQQAAKIDDIHWIKMKAPGNLRLVNQLLEDLDLGEAESIALAVEEQADYLIIDEYRGRRVAEAYGIKITGILGVLILAKKRALIPSVKVNIEKLKEVGFRLNDELVEKVLRSAGE